MQRRNAIKRRDDSQWTKKRTRTQQILTEINLMEVIKAEDYHQVDYGRGTNETLIYEKRETDLQKHRDSCKKNPGHTKFIPIKEINAHHLPDKYNDKEIVDFIKATGDLTVRVQVNIPSRKLRVGTGMVLDVDKWSQEDSKGLCKCQNCQVSDAPSKVWGEVKMYTSRDMVFYDLEAQHTTCRLFYDSEDSPLVTLDGWSVLNANIYEDRCELKCTTCDVDLLDELVEMWNQRFDLWEKINKKYCGYRDVYKMTVIVSHPHGCPKQVSFGHWINRYVTDKHMTQYTYTTNTCQGSSGAYVHVVGYDCWLYYDRHVHIGVNTDGTNYCSKSREYIKYQES